MQTILVIDDNEYMRNMMCDLLHRSGYQTLSAADGVEGLKLYHANKPDLVITDIIMPEKEGLEVIMELARIQPKPKIIAVSGGGIMSPATYLNLARGFGADRIVEKPFRPTEFLELVRLTFEE